MDYRDVDVVLIIPDEKWAALFGTCQNGEVMQFWSLLNTSLSEYISKRTGLRVDFKIQSMEQANGPQHEGKRRTPVGLFINHNEPEWTKKEWKP